MYRAYVEVKSKPYYEFSSFVFQLTIVNRRNGYETWQNSLLHVFVGYFGGRPCTDPDKMQKVVMCAHTTNQ